MCPDFSMCLNDKCPSRELCYRFLAIPHEHRQAYAMFYPPSGTRKCSSYIEKLPKDD